MLVPQIDRASLAIRPRGVLWSPLVQCHGTDPHLVITGVSDKTILLTHIIHSNASSATQLVTIRWGTDTTKSTNPDYFPVYLPSDGGTVAINLIGTEACMGIPGDSLWVVCSDGSNYVYPSIGYMLI